MSDSCVIDDKSIDDQEIEIATTSSVENVDTVVDDDQVEDNPEWTAE